MNSRFDKIGSAFFIAFCWGAVAFSCSGLLIVLGLSALWRNSGEALTGLSILFRGIEGGLLIGLITFITVFVRNSALRTAKRLANSK
jgi:hypothetical protein